MRYSNEGSFSIQRESLLKCLEKSGPSLSGASVVAIMTKCIGYKNRSVYCFKALKMGRLWCNSDATYHIWSIFI